MTRVPSTNFQGIRRILAGDQLAVGALLPREHGDTVQVDHRGS